MSTTSSIQGLGNTPGSILSTGGGDFGDNPFLVLLTAQLRNQTPLEPVDNASFMEQVATYSSMEEQKNLNENMLALLDYQGLLARLQGLSEGSALLGKNITYDTESATGVTDAVASVYVDDQTGEVRLKTEGGDDISSRQITAISNPDQ